MMALKVKVKTQAVQVVLMMKIMTKKFLMRKMNMKTKVTPRQEEAAMKVFLDPSYYSDMDLSDLDSLVSFFVYLVNY